MDACSYCHDQQGSFVLFDDEVKDIAYCCEGCLYFGRHGESVEVIGFKGWDT